VSAVGLLECVVNVSEGRRHDVLAQLAGAAGQCLLDLHHDPDHHRSVLTMAGPGPLLESAVRDVGQAAVALLDLSGHSGAHPRLGVLDVVPFVDLASPRAVTADALAARDRFAAWAGDALTLPCFRYGPERSLPEVRRRAFVDLAPDAGPSSPHPTAGASAVGARPVLVAYNLWVASDLPTAQRLAAAQRSPNVRALGLRVGAHVQVSCNLLDPYATGPVEVYDAVAASVGVSHAELVGLIPQAVLHAAPPERWRELDLAEAKTIESRLREAGLDDA
jgi:glutamate formiminotransferase